MTDQTALPLYLQGRFAPVPEEHSAADLTVRGSLPPDLDGRYLRNGPNPLPGQDTGHWFTGHGMLHGIRLRGGRAEWYRNRWIRTRKLEGHPFIRGNVTVDLTVTPANTHVIRHADTVLALCEAGLPYWVSPSLETVGPYDFGGRLTTAMTAHPKEDPVTGELHLFGTGFAPPYLTYHRVTAEGQLLDSRPIDVPGPTMMHDFAITEHHIVWMDLPVVFDPALAGRGGMPYRWDEEYGARLGVMSRTPGSTDVRWYDVDPCYVFHVGNAYEDAAGAHRAGRGALRPRRLPEGLGGHRRTRGPEWPGRCDGAGPFPGPSPSCTAGPWTRPPAASPSPNWTTARPSSPRTTRPSPGARTATCTPSPVTASPSTTSRATPVTPTRRPAAATPGEAVFVPAADGTGEDEGWLLSLVSNDDGAGRGSCSSSTPTDLSVQAVVELPYPVPAGFHGSWLPEPVQRPRGL